MRTIDELAELVELVSGSTPVYLRYSRGPDEDAQRPSMDYEADVELPGLPATNLWPEPWWPRQAIDWVARRVCKYLDLADRSTDRRAWALTGHVAGYGPDHEPLLAGVEPIAWLGEKAIAQARERYVTYFDAGRDSIG